MTPKDLDFIEAKHGAAREIALALGVPPPRARSAQLAMLLGIPGDNTFSNYQEANRTFWRQTVLPLVQRTTAALGEWLGPAYRALRFADRHGRCPLTGDWQSQDHERCGH